MGSHTGEFWGDGGALSVEFVADGAGGLEREFSFRGITTFEDERGEVRDEFFSCDSGWAFELFENDASAFCERLVGMISESIYQHGTEVFGGDQRLLHRVEERIGPFGAID